jgi:hypothetical protein
MRVADFKAFYWMKTDLTAFARKLGLPTHGYKPELSERIEHRLRGIRFVEKPAITRSSGARDSEKPLKRKTPVANYMSDDKTRAFFVSEIGRDFHFTYYLNQFRLAREGLTYGDLVDEWLAERTRRRSGSYQPASAEHGKYNRYIRDFFADPQNAGKSLRDSAASWNAVRQGRGDHRYKSRKRAAKLG